jgi:hypothetical protein
MRAESAPAVALLLYCLQDSVAWLALGTSSSPFGVLAFVCALPAHRRCEVSAGEMLVAS